jgi:hypothetical protein
VLGRGSRGDSYKSRTGAERMFRVEECVTGKVTSFMIV